MVQNLATHLYNLCHSGRFSESPLQEIHVGIILLPYLLNISGRPDRFSKDTRVKQEVLMKPVRSLPQVIEMLLITYEPCPNYDKLSALWLN